MSSAPIRLLLLEDNPGDARLVQAALAAEAPGAFAITTVERLAHALTTIKVGHFDAMLCDLGLPDSTGVDTAKAILADAPTLPLVVLTGSQNEDLGRAAIELGAQDYLVKGEAGGATIARLLRYAIERKRLENALHEAGAAIERRVAERTAALTAANEALRASEEHYRAVTRTAVNAIISAGADGNIAGWNPAAEHIFGYGEAEALGRPVSMLMPERYRGAHAEGVRRVLAGGEAHTLGTTVELHGLSKAGAEFPMELSLAQWQSARGHFFSAIIRDISERRAAEARIQRLTNLYAALSQCNQAIMRCASAEELFPQVCRVAVEFGGMNMAWIGINDPDTRMVRVAASSGEHADEYLQGIKISLDADSPFGRGPTGTAMRENRPFWSQDFANDPATAPWHKRSARAGWGASAALPLHRNGAIAGSFNLYTREAHAFDQAERDLLVELAVDISYALTRFAMEAASKQAGQALRAAEEQFRGLVEQSIAGIYIIQDGKFAYVNPRFAEIFGYASAEELLGRDPLSIVAAKDRATSPENLRRRIEGEITSIDYSFTALRKDGSTVEVGAHGAAATYRGRPAVIGLMQDISEKKRAEEQVQRYVEDLKTAFMSTVRVATMLSEMRDPYTAGHERRVADIAAGIGAKLGLDQQRIEGLRVAGFMHDIGKVTIPSEILSKPGKLSIIEFELIKGHAQAGYDVLKDVEFPWPVAQVALQHHERIDGSGYPQGLKGDAILLEARILAVADVVEAMASHRPYREAIGIDKALVEIERGRGTAYDAVVADACLKLFREEGYAIPQ